MKLVLNWLMFVGCVMVLNACSKEKKVEKWLKRGVGEWETNVRNVKVYENDTLQSDNTYASRMKIIFDENGSFLKVSYTDADQTIVNGMDVITGKWTSTEDEILVEYGADYPLTMKILEIERKKMKLESTEKYGSMRYVETCSFEKVK